jgi:hypothetical protein
LPVNLVSGVTMTFEPEGDCFGWLVAAEPFVPEQPTIASNSIIRTMKNKVLIEPVNSAT